MLVQLKCYGRTFQVQYERKTLQADRFQDGVHVGGVNLNDFVQIAEMTGIAKVWKDERSGWMLYMRGSISIGMPFEGEQNELVKEIKLDGFKPQD